jgi:shikimate dehydrogenase
VIGQPDIRVALIGAGIAASLTPALHEREAELLDLDYTYELLDLDDEDDPVAAFGPLLDRARADGLRGVNVTHPCKQVAAAHCDVLSREAAALGAVNTIVFADDGRAAGHNTDWPGFVEGFRRGLGDVPTGHVVVLGAGGAGSAAAHAAARDLGARRVSIVDADAERAADLARDVGEAATPDDVPGLLTVADGLVHATPTGMAAHPGIALDPDLLHPGLWVAEVVYRPLHTPLLEAARERGCRTLDGGGMAVFQAVHALRLFTGVVPDAERMLEHFDELVAEEGASWRRA